MAAAPLTELPPEALSFLLVLSDGDLGEMPEPINSPAEFATATALEFPATPPPSPPDTLLALIAGCMPTLPPRASILTPEAPTPDGAAPAAMLMPTLTPEKPTAASDSQTAPEDAAAAIPETPFEMPEVLLPSATAPSLILSATASTTASLAPTAPPITTPVGDAQWPDAVAESIVWSAGQQLQEALIQLTPDDMGLLEIHIRIEDDITHVQFQAAHALTREALQNALPQLAPLLAQQGLKLGDAQVGSQTPQGSGRHPSKPGLEKSGRTDTACITPLRLRGRRGLVDDYV